MHRKIQIKQVRKGTFARFFNNLISAQDAGTEDITFLVTGLEGKPLRIADTEEQALFSRNDRNNFVFDDSHKVITGRTTSQKLDFELSPQQQDNIRKNFIEKQSAEFGKTSVSAVFFEPREVSDFFIDIGITRSTDVLNTLSVHNNVIDETPTLEAATGVLFGRLEAIQKIKNEKGEKIRIPLANVPVAVFNPSDEFPTISSADPDGNRISLNLKENSSPTLYFNGESFTTDQEFLKDDSSFSTISQKYKHTATTNEKGEFAIFDIPVGEQVFMFEIDLLKQGLTKDEVSLNFFPYPAEETPNIDSVPHLFFRQIPVNIVPAWGDFQSGYTELNITVPLDLRKWATYYTSPMSFSDKTLTERQNTGYNTPLTFVARNMSRDGFPLKKVEVVEISDLLKKDVDQQLMWDSEFKQLKNKAEFRENDFQAFKLPANLYDPDGIGTNGLKGVWLCAYQVKMFYLGGVNKIIPNDSGIYRETGFERNYVPAPTFAIDRSHFDLNRHTNSTDLATLSATTGVFPYEKPWSINYPEKYSIPKIPIKRNPNKKFTASGIPLTFKEPAWLDGDRIGGPTSKFLATGYGLQKKDGTLRPNLFSQRVTAGVIFRYERDVSWEEQYSNGFHPVLDGTTGNESKVENGERFQRVEAGYGYWLRPEGWPRIANNGWGWEDQILSGDFSEGTNPAGLSPASYSNAVKKFPGEVLAIKLDDTSSVKRGALDIYRVADPKSLVPPGPPFTEKSAEIQFQSIYIQNENTRQLLQRPTELIIGTQPDRPRYASGEGHMTITNNGIIDVTVLEKKIRAGETATFDNQISSGLVITFPANSKYNSNENSYDIALYNVIMTVNIPKPSTDVTQTISINVVANKTTPSINYVTSQINTVQTDSKIKKNGDIDCNVGAGLRRNNVLIDGLIFTASESNVVAISLGSAITPSCTNNIPHTLL